MDLFKRAFQAFDASSRNVITEQNLLTVCEEWKEKFASHLNPQQAVKCFLEDLEKGVLPPNTSTSSHISFWSKYTKPLDMARVLSRKDRLVNLWERRLDGEFFTPLRYASQAHSYLNMYEDLYERNWWDMCCGTGNLTRACPKDMPGHLYMSTLNQEDIDIINSYGDFRQATVFSLDFLNSESIDKLDFDTKQWVFILNPPYTASATVRDEHKEGVSDTLVGATMRSEKLGKAAQNLTAQFLHRIINLVEKHDLDVIIGMFTQPTFITNPGFLPLYELWRSVFGFEGGFCFHCSEFEGTTGEWPVLFTIWRSVPNDKLVEVEIYEQREVIGKKVFNGATNPMNKWIERPKNVITAPPFTSAITVATPDKTVNLTRLPLDAIGFAVYAGNDVMHSKQSFLLSAPYANGSGWGITRDNIEDSLVAVGSRAIIKGTWLNDRDQFSVPNIQHPLYEEFKDNLMLWLLFSNFNHTCSLENVTYNDVVYDIKNHFFWREKTWVADWLQQKPQLWDEAIVLWKFCDELYDLCEKYRDNVKVAPQYQIQRPDAGWYQIRKAFYASQSPFAELPPLYKQYKKFHKELTLRLIPLVYEMGILPMETHSHKKLNSKNNRLHRLIAD